MMKFFRKHNKELLVVFMAALMVVFVGGSALTSLLKPQGTNDVLAHSDLGDLTQRDLIQANAMTELLDRLGHSWQQPLGPLGTEPITHGRVGPAESGSGPAGRRAQPRVVAQLARTAAGHDGAH